MTDDESHQAGCRAAWRRVFLILKPVNAITIDITGDNMLKMQHGIYTTVATPRTALCVTPQEFHGISTDVTLTLSSIVRLRSRGSRARAGRRCGTYCRRL